MMSDHPPAPDPPPFTVTPLTHPEAQPFRWEGNQPACLLLHGLTSSPWEVRPVALALRAAGFHAESMWLPGHGSRVEALHAVRWRDWTGAIEARFDAMRAEHDRVAVLGTSLGGTLALWLAATRPVAAVVPMGAPIKLRRAALLARWMAYVRPFVPKRPQGSAIRDDHARRIHPSYPRSSMRAIAETVALTRALRPRLPRIIAPCLVMHARQDSVVAPSNAELLYRRISSPRKELLWLEESDHIITEDFDRERVAAAAVRWIESVAP